MKQNGKQRTHGGKDKGEGGRETCELTAGCIKSCPLLSIVECRVSLEHAGVPHAGRLKQQQFIPSQPWRLEVQDRGARRVGFLFSQPVSSHLAASLQGLPPRCVFLSSSSSRDTSRTGLGPMLVTSFYLVKDPVGGGVRQLRIQYLDLGGDTIQPITGINPPELTAASRMLQGVFVPHVLGSNSPGIVLSMGDTCPCLHGADIRV